MVAVMIAAILGGTAFLYSRTGTDALPQETVTFSEQTLRLTAGAGSSRCWAIRSTRPTKAEQALTDAGARASPILLLVLPDWVTAAELQIRPGTGLRPTALPAHYTQNRGLSDHRDRAPRQSQANPTVATTAPATMAMIRSPETPSAAAAAALAVRHSGPPQTIWAPSGSARPPAASDYLPVTCSAERRPLSYT